MTEVVACPICNESVMLSCVNRHIDSGCAVDKKPGKKPDLTNIDENANDDGSSRQDSKIKDTTSRSNNGDSSDRLSLKRKFGSLGSQNDTAKHQSTLGTGKTPSFSISPPTKTASRLPSTFSDNNPPQSPTVGGGKEKAKVNDRRQDLSRPLADRARPTSLEDYVGQEDLLGDSGEDAEIEGVLRGYLESGTCPSFIFWGPPGVGKTTLARIIAKESNSRFVELSASSHGTADCKRIFEEATKSKQWIGSRNTILFLDEVHRFNRAQQDIFLPYVERGDITLIGATTENPSFKVNAALLSRCRVFILKSLEKDQLRKVMNRALDKCFPTLDEIPGCKFQNSDSESIEIENGNGNDNLKNVKCLISEDCIEYIASVADGDARTSLNMLEMAVNLGIQRYRGYLRKAEWISKSNRVGSTPNEINIVTEMDVKTSLKRTTFVYDQSGDAHYDTISAFHKAVRGSDANAALYYLARMLQSGEDPLYVARRMVRIASEDIGIADETCLPLATAAYLAAERLGMPECDVVLAQTAVKLALAKKSVAIYRAWNAVKSAVKEEGNSQAPIPLYIRNAPTKLMSDLGYSQGYKYNPDYKNGKVKQEYIPDSVKRKYPDGFLDLSRHLGDQIDPDLIK